MRQPDGAPHAPGTANSLPACPLSPRSWNAFYRDIHEDLVKEQADLMVSLGLRDVGRVHRRRAAHPPPPPPQPTGTRFARPGPADAGCPFPSLRVPAGSTI